MYNQVWLDKFFRLNSIIFIDRSNTFLHERLIAQFYSITGTLVNAFDMNTATYSNDVICPCDFRHKVRSNSMVPSIMRRYKLVRTVIHFNERTVSYTRTEF